MGKRRRKTLRLVGLALVAALLLAACGGGGDGEEATGGEAEKGGVYRTEIATPDFGFVGGFDPTGEYLGFAFTLYGAMTRNLVSYKHVAGAAGNELFPDLAADLPEISADGLTYTFKLKPGIQFGPPVSREITSKDIAYAFARINDVDLVAQYGFYYDVIEGITLDKKETTPVSGIETPDDQTIIFHLTEPTGDFLYRLAMPAAAPIPEEVAKCFDQAGEYGRYVISSGPYMFAGSDQLDISSCDAMDPIAGFDPSKRILLVRNPNYDQSTDNLRSNNVDGIDIQVNTNLEDIFNKIQAGTLDGSIVDLPPATVLQQYRADPSKEDQVHVNSGDRTWYIFMNLAVAPFDDIHVRKATNLVMDKAAILQAWGGSTFGDIATHVMPPILLNNQLTQEYDPYATPDFRGDVEAAKAEMKQSKYDTNQDGTCDADACKNIKMINRNYGPWKNSEPAVVQSLAKIGIDVNAQELATGAAYQTVQTVENKIAIGLNAGWGKDFPDPITFAEPLFAGASIQATGNVNYSLVGLTQDIIDSKDLKVSLPGGQPIPGVDDKITECQAIPATDLEARTACFVEFDQTVMEDIVPWVPYLWAKQVTIVNDSVTKYEFDQFSGYISITQIAVNNNAQPTL